jgi:hypothetical protein
MCYRIVLKLQSIRKCPPARAHSCSRPVQKVPVLVKSGALSQVLVKCKNINMLGGMRQYKELSHRLQTGLAESLCSVRGLWRGGIGLKHSGRRAAGRSQNAITVRSLPSSEAARWRQDGLVVCSFLRVLISLPTLWRAGSVARFLGTIRRTISTHSVVSSTSPKLAAPAVNESDCRCVQRTPASLR